MTGTVDPLLPPRLLRGDTIGLVAPAGPIVEEAHFTAGVRILREFGFEVRFARDLPTRGKGYLSATDEERARELLEIWADPEVKAVFAARGGYGSLRILSALDGGLFRTNPKIFVGFSDITSLHAALGAAAGLVTFHGPVVTSLGKIAREDVEQLFRTLTGREPRPVKPPELEVLRGGRARGRLAGGNLETLVHLLGTPWQPAFQDRLLFLEDINEAPYRLDRALTQLHLAGNLAGVAGIILGTFEACGDIEIVWQRVLELTEETGIPVWANFPAGHGKKNVTLPLGVLTEMDSNAGVLHFLEPCVAA